MQAWFREFMKNRARPGIRIRARLDSRRQIEDRAMMTDAKADSSALEGPSGPPLSRFERQRGKILDAATMLLNQRGIPGMTLQAVEEKLGIKTTAVPYYFRYKSMPNGRAPGREKRGQCCI